MRIQYSASDSPSSWSRMTARSSRATTRKTSANPPWSSSGTRSGRSCSMPRARRSAIVRESSCSIGRYSTVTVTNSTDQSSEMFA